jgi:hypothetical protein
VVCHLSFVLATWRMAADGKEKKKSDEEEWTEQVEPQSPKRKQSFEQGVRSGKRQRKAADTFAPSLYYAEPKQHRVRVVVGRGVKLFKIPEIRESIRSSSKDSLELKNAFKLLYRPPGKTPIPDMKQSLLDFSGYLPVFDGSEDQEKQEKMVEDAEVRWMLLVFFLFARANVRTNHCWCCGWYGVSSGVVVL